MFALVFRGFSCRDNPNNVALVTFAMADNQKAGFITETKHQKSVFYDEFAVQFFDEDNSVSENRFLMLGFSDEARLLIFCHCERDEGNIVRIISARKATKNEGNYYQGIGL